VIDIAALLGLGDLARGGGLVGGRRLGWLHGSREAALETARELSENLGLPIREAQS
jgi:hypothetical protein